MEYLMIREGLYLYKEIIVMFKRIYNTPGRILIMLLETYFACLSLGNKYTFIFIEFNYLWHVELVWNDRKNTKKVWVRVLVLLLPVFETWTKYILSVLLFICINYRNKLSSFLKRDVRKIKIRQCIEKYLHITE